MNFFYNEGSPAFFGCAMVANLNFSDIRLSTDRPILNQTVENNFQNGFWTKKKACLTLVHK